MDVKTSVSIDITKGERVYSFVMPAGAPFGEAYDAAYEILHHIVEYSKKAAEAVKQAESSTPN